MRRFNQLLRHFGILVSLSLALGIVIGGWTAIVDAIVDAVRGPDDPPSPVTRAPVSAPRPVPTYTLTPDPDTTPTPRPVPTRWPTPTPNPRPTITPRPTSVSSCTAPAARQYKAALAGHRTDLETVYRDMGALLTQAGQNPYLFFDPDWKIAIALEIVLLEARVDDLADMRRPPPFLTQMHNLVLTAVREHRQLIDALVKGIDNVDEEALSRADTLANDISWTWALVDATWQAACQ